MMKKVIDAIALFAIADATIESETKILDEGIIDSLNVMQIIAELERVFDKRIPVTQVVLDDFASPSTIVEALERIWEDD